MTKTRNHRTTLFAVLAAMVAVVEWSVSRSSAFARGGVVPVAVLVDLVVVLPLVYFFLVLRPAKRPLLAAAPVLALGMLVAGAIVGARPETKALVRAGGALTEIAVLALLVRRLREGARELRSADGDDLLLRVGGLNDPMLRFLGAELLAFYYAFVGSFRRRPLHVSEFGYTKDSGVGGILFLLGFVTAMEGFAAHVLVHAYSPRAAWILAALNVYALVWFVAAYQAARLRPMALSAERLLVRVSVLWTVEVPRETIAAVQRVDDLPRGKGVLRAAFGTAPNLLVTLTVPAIARGPLGIAKSVTRIALYVDEPERLRAALDTTVGA